MSAINVRVRGGESTARTSGYAKVLAVSNNKSRLFSLRVFNKAVTDCYILIFDSAAAPSDLTNLKEVIKCLGDSYTGEEFGDGLPFDNGIYIYASQSSTALSAIAGSDALIGASYNKERV
jgi:hypothetical protein